MGLRYENDTELCRLQSLVLFGSTHVEPDQSALMTFISTVINFSSKVRKHVFLASSALVLTRQTRGHRDTQFVRPRCATC